MNERNFELWAARRGVHRPRVDDGFLAVGGNRSQADARRQRKLSRGQLASQARAWDEARAEYERLLAAGEIVEETAEGRLIRTANGHPDNAVTQAARRVCAKRGLDWRGYGNAAS